jgi:gamma-glutamyltranspeptidase/glutathione hydrolase
MVTAPHALASQIGIEMLAGGGNAADAIIAMAAGVAVLYPHMTGVGGDAFILYHDAAQKKTFAYNGSGAAAALATRDFYRERGMSTIPEKGGPAALTVPGAVDLWFGLHERFGSRPMEQIVAPAAQHARHGAPLARSVVRGMVEQRDSLLADAAACDFYAARDYSIGDRFAQPQLARTLEMIATNGRRWLYEGEGAERISAACERAGSPLRAADLAAHHGIFCEPLEAKFREWRSLVTPPNSQGVALLLAQQIYQSATGTERLDDAGAAFAHLGIEAIKAAFHDRDSLVGDPAVAPPVTSETLGARHAAQWAKRIDPYRAAGDAPTASESGTTYFACVDENGNAASMIQSLYHHFGSSVGVPELGIVLQNRGVAFTLDQGKLTSLEAGRRPFHTLMAAMLLEGEAPYLVYGTMGGDGQPQTCLQNSIRIAERGMDPQVALDAPRWRYGRTWGAHQPGVMIEARAGEAVIAGLRTRGHGVIVADAWEQSMGNAGAIVIDRERGILVGASDARSDGAALGL